MDQHILNQAVAETTGEAVSTIAALGFSLMMPPSGSARNRLPFRRGYPLRLIREPRKRPPPKRKPKAKEMSLPAQSNVIQLFNHPTSTNRGA